MTARQLGVPAVGAQHRISYDKRLGRSLRTLFSHAPMTALRVATRGGSRTLQARQMLPGPHTAPGPLRRLRNLQRYTACTPPRSVWAIYGLAAAVFGELFSRTRMCEHHVAHLMPRTSRTHWRRRLRRSPAIPTHRRTLPSHPAWAFRPLTAIAEDFLPRARLACAALLAVLL